jgi:hypothetical protein
VGDVRVSSVPSVVPMLTNACGKPRGANTTRRDRTPRPDRRPGLGTSR